jgi:hypothetical protein
LRRTNPTATPGLFALHHCRFGGESKKSIMIIDFEEDCQACTDSIVLGLLRTSEFRTRKANQYDDPRNEKAAETLKQLAKIAAERNADFWNLLQAYYNPDSREWQNAVSLATRDVGFSNKSKSYAFFVQRLVHIASQSSSSIAA